MNIAFDLRYADGHFTGVGTHAYLLLWALLDLDSDDCYSVLWNPKPRRSRFDVEPIATHPRVKFYERPIQTMHPREPMQLGAWLRETRPDLYLSPFYWLPLGAPCPCVLTIHDLWPLRLSEDLDAWRRAALRFVLWFAARAQCIVTVSEFSRREILELMRLPPERVHVARPGVSPLALGPSLRPVAVPDEPFALVVGDNRPRKNLELLTAVWAAMGADVPLNLVGAGPVNRRFPSLRQLAEKNGAQGVFELGWIPEEELSWLYANATLVLYPTLYEGFGLPLTEAFTRGLPAVVSDIPVLREIGEGAARFVSPSDVNGWLQAVRDLSSDCPERTQMKEAGLLRARTLTYRHTAERTLEILRYTADSRGTDRA